MTDKLTELHVGDKIDIYIALMDKWNKMPSLVIDGTTMIFDRGKEIGRR
jgi:hypothetical protein